MKYAGLILLLLYGCGDTVQEESTARQMRGYRSENAQLRAELAVRMKPEADAITELQAQLKTSQKITSDQALLIAELQAKPEVEVIPLANFIKQTRNEINDLKVQLATARGDIVKLDQALDSHKSFHP